MPSWPPSLALAVRPALAGGICDVQGQEVTVSLARASEVGPLELHAQSSPELHPQPGAPPAHIGRAPGSPYRDLEPGTRSVQPRRRRHTDVSAMPCHRVSGLLHSSVAAMLIATGRGFLRALAGVASSHHPWRGMGAWGSFRGCGG